MSGGGLTTRLADLLGRGPVAPPRSRGHRLRRVARDGVLRVLRPYSAYQHEVDEAILEVLEGLVATTETTRRDDARREDSLSDVEDGKRAREKTSSRSPSFLAGLTRPICQDCARRVHAAAEERVRKMRRPSAQPSRRRSAGVGGHGVPRAERTRASGKTWWNPGGTAALQNASRLLSEETE